MACAQYECQICGGGTEIRGPFSNHRHDLLPHAIRGAGAGGRLTLAVCGNCGHAVRTPIRAQTANLELQQDVFGRRMSGAEIERLRRRVGWPRLRALVARETCRIVEGGGRALDIGCGDGRWLATLGSDWEKYGIELSAESAEVARAVSGAEVFNGDFGDFAAPQASFNLITAFSVMEHLTQPEGLLARAHELLEPGGVLVLATPDRESVPARRLSEQWPMYWAAEHCSFFSARSLRMLLDQVGFEVVREEWRGARAPTRLSLLNSLVCEVARMVSAPVRDQLYVYARSR